jgi:hypothetical protein
VAAPALSAAPVTVALTTATTKPVETTAATATAVPTTNAATTTTVLTCGPTEHEISLDDVPSCQPNVAPPPPPPTAVPGTTTTTTKKGTRGNPYGATDLLTFGDYNPFVLFSIDPEDYSTIKAANQFNTVPPVGQFYLRVGVTAMYTGDTTGKYGDIAFSLGIVGNEAKIYKPVFLSGDELQSLQSQPDVIRGGSITGFLYYLVDTADANFLAVIQGSSGTQFITVGA